MPRIHLMATAALTVLLGAGFSNLAHGQSSLFSNSASSAFQSGNSFGAGSNAFGNSNISSSQFGAGAGVGSGGIGGGVVDTSAGQVTGGERFLEENRQGAFVGADTGDTVNVLAPGQAGQFGLQNNPFAQIFNAANRGGQFNNASNNEPQVRIRYSAQITAPVGVSVEVASRFEQRLARIPALESANGIRVRIDGRTCVLEGSVSSEYERELVERLAKLEPGISTVENSLVVGSETTDLAPPVVE